jgi:hypothetical protein
VRNSTESFPDLGFVEAGGILQLRRPIPEVSCLRVVVPRTEPLQLVSVLVDADGIDDLVRHTTRTMNGGSKEAQQRLQDGLLFDPDNMAPAVQTARQKHPWLEIEFDHPVTLRRILLRNICDEQMHRWNRGIQVLVRTGNGCWTTIYDGVERERAFVRAVEQRYAGQTLPQRAGVKLGGLVGRQMRADPASSVADAISIDRGADLAKLLTAIHLGDYANAETDLHRVDLTTENESLFRALVNAQIAGRRREWSLHGIKRTFRFWPEQEKQDYVGFAVEVARSLQELNENVSLGFGTVLGLVRDQDLIAHDDDADVIIGFEPEQASTLNEGRELIKQCLKDHRYIVSKDRVSHYWVESPGINRKLDVFPGIFEGDDISWFPGKRGVLTRQMMFPAINIDRFGHSCPVPREPERYLEEIYGPNWKTPNENFRHQKSHIKSQYRDILY